MYDGCRRGEEERPSPCMALYCMGVMCSKPGGGTSQYFFTLIFFFSRCGERLRAEREKDAERQILNCLQPIGRAAVLPHSELRAKTLGLKN